MALAPIPEREKEKKKGKGKKGRREEGNVHYAVYGEESRDKQEGLSVATTQTPKQKAA